MEKFYGPGDPDMADTLAIIGNRIPDMAHTSLPHVLPPYAAADALAHSCLGTTDPLLARAGTKRNHFISVRTVLLHLMHWTQSLLHGQLY